jgi:hypothetical protein
LTASDATLVHKNVASKNHNICYEARLVSMQGERLSKPKKVFCYVSPKQLTVKEFLLKFIPKRLVTFRLCPSTKVSAQVDMVTFEVSTTLHLTLSMLSFLVILNVFLHLYIAKTTCNSQIRKGSRCLFSPTKDIPYS